MAPPRRRARRRPTRSPAPGRSPAPTRRPAARCRTPRVSERGPPRRPHPRPLSSFVERGARR
ncbi:MAG: hypothetical protein EOO72_15415 [Myxococcaceae bacterium]|nr:MAG: hypothetical protein EOO72_15415 [Myxococcaceae bacterium]